MHRVHNATVFFLVLEIVSELKTFTTLVLCRVFISWSTSRSRQCGSNSFYSVFFCSIFSHCLSPVFTRYSPLDDSDALSGMGPSAAGGIALAEASLIVIEDVDIAFESDTGYDMPFPLNRFEWH